MPARRWRREREVLRPPPLGPTEGNTVPRGDGDGGRPPHPATKTVGDRPPRPHFGVDGGRLRLPSPHGDDDDRCAARPAWPPSFRRRREGRGLAAAASCYIV